MSDQKITSFDIAYQAGVSQSTVSRAMRNSKLVSLETRKKVQAIAKELNYQVDRSASSLRSKTTKTLALLLNEDPGWGEAQINPFFLSMLSSIAKATAANGYDLLLSFQQSSEDWASEFENAHRADGIILLGYGDHEAYQQKTAKLIESHTPFIVWGAPLSNDSSSKGASCNNADGGYKITRHLIKLGRKHFIFLGNISASCYEFSERYRGHRLALREAGLQTNATQQFDAESSEQAGFAATTALLESGQRCDAIVSGSDLIAMGAILSLKEKTIHVPNDIAVVGFDNLPMADYIQPALTTVHQDTLAAGKLLVENLIRMLHGEEIEPAVIPVSLVIRESCGSTN